MESFTSSVRTPSNNVYTAGISVGLSSSVSGGGVLTLFDSSGSLVWSKKYNTGFENNNRTTGFYNNISYTRDNNLIVIGKIATPQGECPLLMKVDLSGAVLWTKAFPSHYTEIFCTTLEDSSIIYAINTPFGEDKKPIIGKLDKNGNQIWSKTINLPRPLSGYLPYANANLLVNNGQLFVHVSTPDDWNKRSHYFFKVNASNGTVSWSKKIIMNGNSTSVHGLAALNNLLYYTFSVADLYNPGETIFGRFVMDETGSIKKVTAFKQTTEITNFHPFEADPFLVSLYGVSDNYFALAYINDSGIVEWKNKYTINLKQIGVISVSKSPPGGWLIYSTYVVGNNSYHGLLVSKLAANGQVPQCNNDTLLSISKVNASFNMQDANYSFSDTTIITNGIVILNAPHTYSAENICISAINCNSLKLQGTDTICSFRDTVTYVAKRSNGCPIPVKWQFDTSFVSFSSLTDTSLTIQLKKSGIFKIKGYLLPNCTSASDSILVTANNPPPIVDLGADTTICEGERIILNAGQGYVKYLWQDNSSDSSILISQAGLYFVTVTDACGKKNSDTIVVSIRKTEPFNLGPDLRKCNKDSVIIVAPPGFYNFNWVPNYAINNLNTQQVLVFPDRNTTYTATAIDKNGCKVSDSIQISVDYSPAINLGKDENICKGDTIRLDAGPGFKQYLWNNGSTAQQITANTKGIYIVKTIAFNNCSSTDTIEILKEFINPVVTFNHRDTICSGSYLSTLNSFKAYKWQDGTTNPSILINNIGNYWVSVIDENGCIGRGTLAISTILPTPKAFLPADTTVCLLQPLLIKPFSAYKSYLWSNGSTNPQIITDKPGNFWLRVLDNNSCSGTDSIVVKLKNCEEAFFIPTAFSPNKNGTNEVFRPLLTGNVDKYEFSIFNRWGQPVFYSTEVQQGWDGTINSVTQGTSVFVWQCLYKFQGKSEVLKKGTVLLLR